MARDLFLLVLALLTVVAGVALAIALMRRHRERKVRSGARGARYGLARPGGRRRIDDFAAPIAFDDSPKVTREIDEDAGKICPRCGARYGSHHRFCEHDNSELAALN